MRGRCAALSKERGSLAKLALSYGRYLDLGRQISEAEEVCSPRKRRRDAFVRRGRACRAAKQARNRGRVASRLALRPQGRGRCTRPSSWRFAPVPGAMKRALFARDLYEMYRRFAERMGWKFEVLDMEATELGGFREVSFSFSGDGGVSPYPV